MIVFDLSCSEGHRFEGWFGSSDDYADQKAGGLLVCPQCGSEEIGKAPMAPSVPAKSNTRSHAPVETTQVVKGEMPVEVKKALEKLAKAQAKALELCWSATLAIMHTMARVLTLPSKSDPMPNGIALVALSVTVNLASKRAACIHSNSSNKKQMTSSKATLKTRCPLIVLSSATGRLPRKMSKESFGV